MLDYTTLFGPHLVQECHFRAPLPHNHSKKWLQFRNGSGQLSGYDMPRNVDPSVKKGVGLKLVSILHAVEIAPKKQRCTTNFVHD